ncbi:fimbrillin family protein [Bacteroides sp.]|uniref:fimbrillin family protein n=1 Tax=Bacteroides sp. TaxID=29523 RepID=UPI003AB5D17F
MNTKPIHLSILSVLLALTACTDGHDSLPPVDTGEDVLHISSVTMEGATDAASRGIITEVGTANGQLSRIGVYTVGYNGTSETEYKPAHGRNTGVYQYASSAWTSTATQPADALRLPTGTGAPTIHAYAWHPATLTPAYQSGGSYVSGVNIHSTDILFDAANQVDYLYSSQATPQAGTPIAFTMNHAMVKLTCQVYKTGSLTEDIHLTKLSITERNNKWVTGEGNMKLTDGVFTGLTNTSQIVMTAATGDASKVVGNSSNPASVYCLVAPTAPTSLRFELEAESASQQYSFQTSYVTPTQTSWVKGQHIVFTIKLDGMDAQVTGIQVYPWDEFTDTSIPVTPEPATLSFSLPQAETRALGAAQATENLASGTLFSVYAYRGGKRLGEGVYQVDATATLASPATINGAVKPLKLTKGKYDLYFFSYNSKGKNAGDYPTLPDNSSAVSVSNGKDFLFTSLADIEIQANQSSGTGTDQKTFSVSLSGAPFRHQCARAKATLEVQEKPVKPETVTGLAITLKHLSASGSYDASADTWSMGTRADANTLSFVTGGSFTPVFTASPPQLQTSTPENFLLPVNASSDDPLKFDLSMTVGYTSTLSGGGTKTQLVELKNYALPKQLQAGKSYNFVFRLTFYGDYKPVGVVLDIEEYTPVSLPAGGVGED